MNSKQLLLIDTGLFCVGMHVKAKLYYKYKETFVLLCKNVTFTTELLEKLRTVARGPHGVYAAESDYEEIWNESLHQYSLDAKTYKIAYKQAQQEYNQILSNTVSFLGEIMPHCKVPLNMANEITNQIAEDLGYLDQSMMLRCINMLQQADNYLYTHCVNVAALNGMVGKWLGFSETEVRRLIKIGLLHDLGKLKVPPKILNKPGRLSESEFDEIKLHPTFSYDMLRQSGETDSEVLLAVRQHHERSNGTGYPDGLNQKDIVMSARITSVCDVYDAMVSKRCYKASSTPFEVLSLFKQNRFSDLDTHIVNTFLNHVTYLFIGMQVKLSNGEDAEVVFVRPTDYANPIVRVGCRIFPTNENCKCIAANNDF